MRTYWVKTPAWVKRFFPKGMIWDIPPQRGGDAVYLTFDDGPHPAITPFVLDELRRCNARATFFCVGNNVVRYPGIYQQALDEGHKTGNHTHDHVNGWHTGTDQYLKNIEQAAGHINSRMFRPPYGRLKLSQFRRLVRRDEAWQVYMWDVLSGDFDAGISPQQCLDNVLTHIRPGSVVVFHDSDKAWERLRFALPAVLDYCVARGWQMAALP